MLASTIMRHEAQLRQVSAQIRQANQIISEAKDACNAAAEELAANWEGDAREAFVAEQLHAKSWLEQMISIIGELITAIDRINDTYTNVDSTIANSIRNR